MTVSRRVRTITLMLAPEGARAIGARRPPAAHHAARSYIGVSGERIPSSGEGTPFSGVPPLPAPLSAHTRG
jgi:hypothetical protein